MFLLDTNVVSELRKASNGKANRGVVAWAASVPSQEMFLSAISLFEIELGVLLAERSDPSKGVLLRQWLNGNVLPAFANRVLPITTEIAVRSALAHVPGPAPFRDSLIGATALEHSLTLVTRNVADFKNQSTLTILNPWA